MAKGKAKVVKNVSDFSVDLYDNGFTLRYSGNDDEDNWADAKIIVTDIEELFKLIREVSELPRN